MEVNDVEKKKVHKGPLYYWLYYLALAMLISIFLGQLFPYLVTRLLGIVGILSPKDYFQFEFMKFDLYYLYFGAFVFLLYYYIFKKNKRIENGDYLHLFKLKPMNIILYVLIGFSLSCCNGYIVDLTGKFFVKSFQNYSRNFKVWEGNNVYTFVILAVIIGPIVQEVAVRHFFSRCLYRSYSLITVILLQAVMFGVGHMNSIQGIYTFIGGILFMVLVLWMDNLYPAVISHMACNLYAVVVSPFLYKYGIDLKMFFAVLIIPLLFMVYKRRQYDALDKNNPYWR
ncbi:CPBP family intramembrane metalloprotease [Acidilutibacter cellobiosedens]|jgi:membrane protease YdiL (CAAX protease family)|uniref:CPBP family intramembrane metalloprotease n=1 Tax=Acidilutibacter cellobiosedens TaxID=2507161 RepID=A0A410QEG4_9FIRM|nr:CPBP family intramembrane metalloprotease [Acidilutibacter cellobiosedens]